MSIPVQEIEAKGIAATPEVLGGNELFKIFTIPQEEKYIQTMRDLTALGLTTIIGNSANLARTRFGEDVAGSTGARFIHTGLKKKSDELSKSVVDKIEPKGLTSLKRVAAFLYATALSKYHRFSRLTADELAELGMGEDTDMSRVITIFGDAEDFADGFVHGKPKDREEAIAQINRAVTGDPYFIINAQVAMWANGTRGVASNIHITPVRVKPSLGRIKSWELRQTWLRLYDDPTVYVTPRGASGSNKEILPFLQVGVARNLDRHVMPLEDTELIGEHEMEWVDVMDLSHDLRDEFATNLMGAAPRGFAQVLSNLVEKTRAIESPVGDEGLGETLALLNKLDELVN